MSKPKYFPDKEYENLGKPVPKLPKRAIAKIRGKSIGRSDYIRWLINRAGNEQLFDQFISNILIEQRAKQLNIKVSEKDVKKLVNEKINILMNKANRNKDNYETMLITSGITEQEFKNRQEVKFRKEVERFLLPSLVIYKEWEIPESRIKERFIEKYGIDGRKYKLKQMFFSIKKKLLRRGQEGYNEAILKVEEEAKEKLEQVLEKIKKKDGENFEKLVWKYSDDKKTKYDEGYLGKYIRGRFGKGFDRVVPELKEGEISEIIKSRKGYHIVKVLKKDSANLEISHIQSSVNYFSVFDRDSWEKDKEKVMSEVAEIIEKLKKSEDFDKFSTESDDYCKAYNLTVSDEWENSWDIVFRDELLKLKKGEISDIIETDKGLHIVMIEGVRVTKYDDKIKEELKKEIAYKIALEKLGELEKELMEGAEIVK